MRDCRVSGPRICLQPWELMAVTLAREEQLFKHRLILFRRPEQTEKEPPEPLGVTVTSKREEYVPPGGAEGLKRGEGKTVKLKPA